MIFLTGLLSSSRLFTGETSVFLVTRDRNTSAKNLNNDLLEIRNMASQWKMNFEVIFSCKVKNPNHSILICYYIQINQAQYKQYLGQF